MTGRFLCLIRHVSVNYAMSSMGNTYIHTYVQLYIPPMKVPILPSSSSVIPKTIAIFSIFMRDQKSVNHLYLLLVFFYSIFIICQDFFIDYIISYSPINWGGGLTRNLYIWSVNTAIFCPKKSILLGKTMLPCCFQSTIFTIKLLKN